MSKTKKVVLSALAASAAFILLGASSCQSGSDSQKAEGSQQEQINQQYVKNQPLPQFNYSQMRQNLIELETAQATGVQTTTFFFNQGVQDPIMSCPSVGVPMPNTASLSNPVGVEHHSGDSSGGNVAVGQMDPNGVYVPESSTGTFVMCIDAQGRAYAQYWEGFVHTVFAPARWDKASHTVELVGPPSFKFSEKKGDK